MKFKEGKLNIAVAGTGYVGLSIATLLAQHHHVTAVDIIEDKVNLINNKKSQMCIRDSERGDRRSHRGPSPETQGK